MTLEWLKTILGDSYTDDIDKKVSDQIGKDFVSKIDFNTVNDVKKTQEQTIKDKEKIIGERDKQLEDLKKVDAAGLQAEITRLQTENTAAKTKFDEDLKATQLDYKLEAKLRDKGVIGEKKIVAVKALLDYKKISIDGNNLIGADDQIAQLEQTEKWAFGASASSGATGMEQGAGASGGEKTLQDETLAVMFPNKS